MFYASGSPRSLEIKNYLENHLSDESKLRLADESISVVIGGDGFFFESIKKIKHAATFLPLNGGTLGYTLNDAYDLPSIVKMIEEKDWKEYSFPKIKVYLKGSDGKEFILDEGANDVYLERSTGQTARLSFRVDDVEMVTSPIICDGVIVSTALGSTGYGLSAGGPIVHPGLSALGITFSNPHAPRISPIMVPSSCEIGIKAHDVGKRPVRVVCDGREILWKRKTGRVLFDEIILRSDNEDSIKVLYFNEHCKTQQLAQKIIRR